MAFWDDLEKKATDATTNVMSRVKGVSDTTRLNSMVAEEEKRIKDIYFKIGQTYVALHGQENDAAFVNLLNALKASQLKVEQYKQEIMDIKGVRRCEKCGAEVQNGAAFCMSCGTPLPRIQPQPVNVGRTCKKCGANLAPGARFCTNCGTPYAEEASGSPSGNSTGNSTGSAMGSAMWMSFGSSKPVEQPNYEPQQREESDSYQEPIQKEEQLQKQWENPAKKVCQACGAELGENTRFCIVCGAPAGQAPNNAEQPQNITVTVSPVTLSKPETQAVQSEPARTKFCTGCGAPLEDDSLFCTECGKKVD